MAYAAPEADGKAIAEAMVAEFAKHGEVAVYHLLSLDTEGVKVIG